MSTIPRPLGTIYDCTDCGWQGLFSKTDSGHCPECGAEVMTLAEQIDSGLIESADTLPRSA